MFVEEDVVARHICGNPQRQVFQLRLLGAAQPDQLLLGVDFLEVEYSENSFLFCAMRGLQLCGYFCLIINDSVTQVILSASTI